VTTLRAQECTRAAWESTLKNVLRCRARLPSPSALARQAATYGKGFARQGLLACCWEWVAWSLDPTSVNPPKVAFWLRRRAHRIINDGRSDPFTVYKWNSWGKLCCQGCLNFPGIEDLLSRSMCCWQVCSEGTSCPGGNRLELLFGFWASHVGVNRYKQAPAEQEF